MHTKIFLSFAMLAFIAAPALAQETAASAPVVVQQQQPAAPQNCAIDGVVTAIQKVEKSAWADGAPSSFSTVEVQISIRVENRYGRGGNSHDYCRKPAAPEMITYKLCSPTPVQAGYHIKAIEGRETGAVEVLGCLFDVSVVSKAP